nr:2-C-methyl-D-erythritol 4-phosphate cytidylyltransferase [candidate division Zixibacteria bacterium]
MKTVALIVAAGRGVRFGGDVPKQFRHIMEKPLLSWTIEQFEKAASIDDIVVVVAEEALLFTNEKIVNPFAFSKVRLLVKGGATRRESVCRGLKALPISTNFVAIHDGARPLIDHADIDRVVDAARKDRAAILARPISSTVKRVEGDYIISTLDRTKLYLAETPQVFQYDLIMNAHEKTASDSEITDDACMIEMMGFKVRRVIPKSINIKITTEEDLIIAGLIIGIRA